MARSGGRAGPQLTAQQPARPVMELLLVAAAGGLQTIAFVHTQAWWLQLACCGFLAWRVARQASAGRAALLGAAYGAAWMWAGVWWLHVSMHRYGGMPAWLSALSVVAFGAFLSLFLALALVLFARCRSGEPLRDALRFGAFWLLAELGRGVALTGFPWLASGYAHVDSPLASLAPWVGVYGVGAVGATLAAWSVFAIMQCRSRWRGVAAGALVLGVLALLGPMRFTEPTGTLSVTLLQGNVDQSDKFSAKKQGGALAWHMHALTTARTDVVIAPETAIPFLPKEMPADFWPVIDQRFATGTTHAVFGLPLGNEGTGYSNSAIALAPGRPHYRYDKHHLVPLGEFTPIGMRWFKRLLDLPLGELNAGPARSPAFVVHGERLAMSICYEQLFGEELALRFANAADEPTMLVNLGNIAWFGDTEAMQQDLQIARMRSLEFERPMLRAANTGATVVIDHRGKVAYALPAHVQGQLEAKVQGRTGMTPYAWWASAFALWPLFALALLPVLALVPSLRPARAAVSGR
ncbi:apolipoprotein N-acyltransferase [Variovorax sp. VaC1]|uniref:apolipoprotein N-acyltransferase n=1 Tax=Variovorax sp. VaC1 TaxID=3373132 RepID=UPI00374944B7